MTSFNDSVIEYKKQLGKGNIQIAYRGLMDYMLELRNFFKNKYPEFSVPGTLYQGYMDMTYFALFPDDLKNKKLKIAVVFLHNEIKFDIWLSGINKQIQTKYWNILKSKNLNAYHLPKTLKGADAIIEYCITDNPNFNDLEALSRQIESCTVKFIRDVKELIKDT